MGIAGRLDDIGKPAWIGLMVLSFIVFWPLGLAVLAFLIWSGRMGCWSHRDHRRRWRERMERMCGSIGERAEPASSGNRAFDEYREETLRRLEEEQKEFKDFLERLRHAKDKAEFEQFMSERARPRDDPAPQPES
jgi:biopolymer transport protein ExbB/TolQ